MTMLMQNEKLLSGESKGLVVQLTSLANATPKDARQTEKATR